MQSADLQTSPGTTPINCSTNYWYVNNYTIDRNIKAYSIIAVSIGGD